MLLENVKRWISIITLKISNKNIKSFDFVNKYSVEIVFNELNFQNKTDSGVQENKCMFLVV